MVGRSHLRLTSPRQPAGVAALVMRAMLPGSDDDTGLPLAGEGRSLPAPSHRQIWLTVVLVGIVLVVGIVLLIHKTQGSTKSITPASGTAATTTRPGTLPIGNARAGSAVALELSLRSKLGGCWDDAEPGGTDGAYRQDFHFATGRPCGGTGWDIDVELFDSTGHAATAAARSTLVKSTYQSANILVVVAPAAATGTRAAVASQPGLSPASPQ
jgi:hypothetical protein